MDNLGLQNYGIALFDGVFHEEQLACVENNGIRRYITGLNPFAPDVKMLPKEMKEARITEINKALSQLEAELNANIVSPDDPDFWNKIKLLKPDNYDFWEKISVRVGNQPVPLDPEKNPFDLIKLYAVEAGGFSIVAKSYDDARSRAVAPKFYLDKSIDTISNKTEIKKLQNIIRGIVSKKGIQPGCLLGQQARNATINLKGLFWLAFRLIHSGIGGGIRQSHPGELNELSRVQRLYLQDSNCGCQTEQYRPKMTWIVEAPYQAVPSLQRGVSSFFIFPR